MSAVRKRERVSRLVKTLETHFGRPRPAPARDLVGELIRTILSQATTDANRDGAYSELRRRFRSWTRVAEAPRSEIAAAIRSGGLSRQKAPRIKALLAWTKERFGRITLAPLREMPTDDVMDLLSGLDGVGPKTAAVLLLFHLERDVFPVDTHVRRVLTRLGFARDGASAEKVHEIMQPLVRRGAHLSLHINLIRFGRAICRAQNPLCADCFLYRTCRWPFKRTRRDQMRRAAGKVNG